MTPRKLTVKSKSQHKEPSQLSGNGGELHQLATGTHPPLTTPMDSMPKTASDSACLWLEPGATSTEDQINQDQCED
jgi:hypothetical protein